MSIHPRLYRLSGPLKGALFMLAMALVVGPLMWYTHQIVQQLRKDSAELVRFYASLYSRAANLDQNAAELQFLFDQIIKRTNFPIISTDRGGTPTAWKGIGIDPNDRSEKALRKVAKIKNTMARAADPIPIKYQDQVLSYLYYGDSQVIQQLRWLPFIEVTVIGLFMLLGYYGFYSITRSEQRFIWVGMAKETAHQLGTPLSSLMGWLEMIRADGDADRRGELLGEMERDVRRLNKVTARFSQIGSKADLKDQSMSKLVADIQQYFSRRLPQTGRQVHIVAEDLDDLPLAPLNKELFEWVMENLVKNALDAIDRREGRIVISGGRLSRGRVFIDVTDNGKGIEFRNKNDVFKAGYSTKKRGWGLGLNLAKRIVEEYHGGRLLVKETAPGEGTTMRIILHTS